GLSVCVELGLRRGNDVGGNACIAARHGHRRTAVVSQPDLNDEADRERRNARGDRTPCDPNQTSPVTHCVRAGPRLHARTPQSHAPLNTANAANFDRWCDETRPIRSFSKGTSRALALARSLWLSLNGNCNPARTARLR